MVGVGSFANTYNIKKINISSLAVARFRLVYATKTFTELQADISNSRSSLCEGPGMKQRRNKKM